MEGLTQTVGCEHARAGNSIAVKQWHICLVITASLSDMEDIISKAMCGIQDGFLPELTLKEPGPFARGSFGQPWVLIVVCFDFVCLFDKSSSFPLLVLCLCWVVKWFDVV